MPNGETDREKIEYGKLLQQVLYTQERCQIIEGKMNDWRECQKCKEIKESMMDEIVDIKAYIKEIREQKSHMEIEKVKSNRQMLGTLVAAIFGSGGILSIIIAWLLGAI